MNILFICSTLEPGRDGVGDYTRMLAAKLVQRGHHVALAAFADGYAKNISTEMQVEDNMQLSVLRLPRHFSFLKRLKAVTRYSFQHHPDYVSLQYVAFGFHQIGLPWHLLLLKKYLKGPFHIMFHELWCGMGSKPRLKEKTLGSLQKTFLKTLVATLKPEIVFTNIVYYKNHLLRESIVSKIVPVFGNIPFDNQQTPMNWTGRLEKLSLIQAINKNNPFLVICLFGTIYPGYDLKQLLEHTILAAKKMDRKIFLIQIGVNDSPLLKKFISNTGGIDYIKTGFLTNTTVHQVMKLVDIGIITTPAFALNKSGTAKAWLERGIPVLVPPGDDSYDKHSMEPNGVFRADDSATVIRCYSQKNRFPESHDLVAAVAAYEIYAKPKPGKLLCEDSFQK